MHVNYYRDNSNNGSSGHYLDLHMQMERRRLRFGWTRGWFSWTYRELEKRQFLHYTLQLYQLYLSVWSTLKTTLLKFHLLFYYHYYYSQVSKTFKQSQKKAQCFGIQPVQKSLKFQQTTDLQVKSIKRLKRIIKRIKMNKDASRVHLTSYVCGLTNWSCTHFASHSDFFFLLQ